MKKYSTSIFLILLGAFSCYAYFSTDADLTNPSLLPIEVNVTADPFRTGSSSAVSEPESARNSETPYPDTIVFTPRGAAKHFLFTSCIPPGQASGRSMYG